jgi:hypothetical protein
MASPSEPDAMSRRWTAEPYYEALARMRETGDAEATRAVTSLEEAYLESVPRLALARCPFTGAELIHSLETRGLDGLWWRYDNPVRPLEEPLPTLFALTGAVKLAREVERFPFLCKPGPEVPFVVPRLLQAQSMRAVVSQVEIGSHQGFAIAYFADPIAEALTRFNDWGTDHYETVDGWSSMIEDVERLDFDVGSWISTGKVAWIAPGDRELRLRDEIDGCPYLGLDGRRSFVRVQGGDVWAPKPTGGKVGRDAPKDPVGGTPDARSRPPDLQGTPPEDEDPFDPH